MAMIKIFFLASVALNIFLVFHLYVGPKKQKLSWSQKAAAEAEAVASISCSGHGRAYLDGLTMDDKPVCECNECYGGLDCSVFLTDCAANADGGDPLFLEPFWIQNAANAAVLISGWHRMSYSFYDQSYISRQLENHIRKVHSIAKNAITKGKYIVFGTGSTQLLSAAVFALSMNLSSQANVVVEAPRYQNYKQQTDFFETARFHFMDDLKNVSNYKSEVIEFVTSPNNPDGILKKAVLKGNSVKSIYDHAYYWPHFTAIPARADEDVMIFTISKLTGHAGGRFGWALVKDKQIYDNMLTYIRLAEMGVSRDTQLRALKLLKAILQGNGKEIFQFAYKTMRGRWEQLSQIISASTRFTIQEIPPQFCNFFQQVRGPSPAYAWVKCERKEDSNCAEVLSRAKITGRRGSMFGSDDRYARLSLIRRQDDFDLLIHRLTDLVSEENRAESM